MRKIITTFLTIIAAVFISNTMAQSFDIRITENDYGYLEVQMRETSGTGTPTTSTIVNDISFEIRWATTLSTDVEIICTSNDYNLADALGSKQSLGAYDFRVFQAATTPLNPPENWTQNIWMTLATFKATLGSGSGTFEIAPNGWVVQGLNWNQGDPPVDYTPSVVGSAGSYDYPTVVYDLVWTGAGTPSAFQDAHSWSLAGNWVDECGGTGAAPTAADNCFIPAGLSNYPENVYLALLTSQVGYAKNLRIEAGGEVNFGIEATKPELLSIAESLNVYGTINIKPNAGVTVSGDTYLDASECMVIHANTDGVGSFIDNGTITYGASGTAKVQTYLSNPGGTTLEIHLVGPTVDMISGGTNGAYLSAFNLVNGNTYAYEWDEGVGFASGWSNIFDNTYVANTAAGIGLSTDDGSTNTLEMTGELVTGSISSPALTFSNNHNELLSNPYPSAIDFDGLAGDNSSVVEGKYWIWDPSSDNYVTRVTSSGGPGPQNIQVGQGFFVQTKQAGTFDFTNARRVHSNDAFRDVIPNKLTVRVFGGMEGYKDELIVRFDDDATSGYDIELEASKWDSQGNDATMIRTIAEDNTELAINVLPLEGLNSGMTSVPMHFNCGYNTEYSLSFYDMETFEYGTEIWLEDKLIGGDWISINDNPDYTFTATPDDAEDRFVIHFFGPTGVDENNIEKTVEIYSNRQYAYVRNHSNELIKKVGIYTLSGALLHDIETADLDKQKFWVSDILGYYVVRVITENNVYTQKVFISK